MNSQTSRRSLLIRALRAASPALWSTRLRLASLKVTYKAGAYSGHPEDTLDGISALERKIWQHTNGTRPVKVAPEPAVEPSPAPASAPAQVERGRTGREQREFEELTARCHPKGGPFEPGLDAAERRLARMQYLYRTGGYMGHPEEMLEDIEYEERWIASLTAEAATV